MTSLNTPMQKSAGMVWRPMSLSKSDLFVAYAMKY